ncbi:hypothetical protein D8B29_06580 [Verminephrobacter eiseniae]|nr:hypothetical protein [Verminephrobacter eiseniae]MCW8179297.1 hypothetical protein [Verminephrobacter eiseniae]MCW8190164.1 hypothetical protein [Verminephrobacter eiseniae]
MASARAAVATGGHALRACMKKELRQAVAQQSSSAAAQQRSSAAAQQATVPDSALPGCASRCSAEQQAVLSHEPLPARHARL